jgi:hypothetical protein
MDLAGQTSFRVDSHGAVQRFSLQRGELSARVAKLTRGQRFIVATPDAEIEVRGTRFRLSVVEPAASCGGGTRTRLDVTEGIVQVRAAGLDAVDVKAGESWPPDCRRESGADSLALLPPPSSLDVPRHAPAPAAPRASAARARSSEAGPAERSSELTPQNDLFAEATALRRSGNTSGALRAFQELITRFPSAPLAENALVERMRLLAGTSEGRAEAQRYLALYPRGFATAEAHKLTGTP